MIEISNEVDRMIMARIRRDLAPSPATIHLKVGSATLLGGVLSLLVCGQFGIGWTSMAETFSERVHDSMDPLVCSLVCGSLYAIFPVSLLRLITSPMQFRTIVFRRFWTFIFWFGGFGATLASAGHHGNNGPQFVAWVFASLVAFGGLAKLWEIVAPAFDLAHFSLSRGAS